MAHLTAFMLQRTQTLGFSFHKVPGEWLAKDLRDRSARSSTPSSNGFPASFPPSEITSGPLAAPYRSDFYCYLVA